MLVGSVLEEESVVLASAVSFVVCVASVSKLAVVTELVDCPFD